MSHDPTLVLVRGLEERAFNAWMPLETMLVDGWVFRFADGYTKRANSVNAWNPRMGARAAADMARPIYAARRLPLIFRLSPLAPRSADSELADDGFRDLDETEVMTAPLSALQTGPVDPNFTISKAPDAIWSEGFAAANRVPDRHRKTHDAMLARVRNPVAFASLQINGRPLAYGLAVAERGYVGLFDIVTAPEARRQGAGRRLVLGLLDWGRRQGATQAYLQVVATNAPAIALYRDLNFSSVYRYHYRVSP